MYTILVIVFLNVLLVNEILGPNIFLDQLAFCKKRKLSKKVADGDYAMTRSEICPFLCSSMILKLNGSFLIHYVAVYEGQRPARINNTGNWDYYSASLLTGLREFNTCGFFNRRALVPAYRKGHRINCMGWFNTYHDIVELKMEKSYGYSIAEIEVVSLGMAKPRRNVMAYRGCFKKFSSKSVEDGHSIDTCGSFCKSYPFAALQDAKCFCGKSEIESNEIENNRCYFKCRFNPGKYCGGKVGYSVYLAHVQLPFLHGCYKEFVKCLKKNCFEDLQMTIAKCLKFCGKNMYGALQFGVRCMCTDEGATTIRDMNKCRIPCYGDPKTNCGGKEHVSLYGTCVSSISFSSCSNIIKCRHDIDEFGICTECLNTFIPPTCIEKDTFGTVFDYVGTTQRFVARLLTTTKKMEKSFKNLTFPITENATVTMTITTTDASTTTTISAITTIVTTTSTTSTTTTPAATRKMITHPCENNPCTAIPYSICAVGGDSHLCDCIDGLVKSDSTTCEDVDECGSFPCDSETSECLNSFGSFSCDCKSGLVLDYNDVCTGNITSAIAFDRFGFPMMVFYALCALVFATLCMVFYYDTVVDADEGSDDEE